MSKKNQQTPYERHRENVNRIIAELDEQLAGWTPKKKEDDD